MPKPTPSEGGGESEYARVPKGFFSKNIRNLVRAIFFVGGGFAYVCFWGLRFYFGPLIARVLAGAVVVFSCIEVFKDVDLVRSIAGSTLNWVHNHWIHRYLPDKYVHDFVHFMSPLWIPVFFVLAAAMALHHHIVMTQVSRSESLVGSLRRTAVESALVVQQLEREHDPVQKLDSLKRYVRKALEGTTQALARHQGLGFSLAFTWKYPWITRARVFASVWERKKTDPHVLHLWCDYPPGTYEDLTTIPMTSAAGRVLEEKKLLYVPRTYFLHGFLLSVPEGGKGVVPLYDSFEFRENIFVPLDSKTKPKSTINIEFAVFGESQYVLCLDAIIENGFKEIDFQVACLLANVVGMALTEAKQSFHQTTERKGQRSEL